MSKVFFTNLHTRNGNNLLQKLEKLMKEAGFEDIDFEEKFVAIKIHFGEPGNLAYLRPNYAKVVADYVKKLGGKPFLTDCNTLYVGRRNNGLVHLEAAYENGYNPFTTGCHIVIADGIKGSDDQEILINEKYVKSAKIGTAIADSDIIISMNHFKGHEMTGIGGALKNIGMGCGSRRGKMEMHSSGKPQVISEVCRSCGKCMEICNQDAIAFQKNNKAKIEHSLCVGCGRCIAICPFHAISSPNDESNDILNKKIAEYTKAVLKGKKSFHINFIMDVSPNCDCHSENDEAIAPNIGIVASFDPVALDNACVDLVKKVVLDDPFMKRHPDTDYTVGIRYAEAIGIGQTDYEFIEVK